jgi:hypothetical protein
VGADRAGEISAALIASRPAPEQRDPWGIRYRGVVAFTSLFIVCTLALPVLLILGNWRGALGALIGAVVTGLILLAGRLMGWLLVPGFGRQLRYRSGEGWLTWVRRLARF